MNTNGRLVQTDVDSLVRIDIGPVAHASTRTTAFVSYGGHTPGMLFPTATGVPTSANSLARLTTNLP